MGTMIGHTEGMPNFLNSLLDPRVAAALRDLWENTPAQSLPNRPMVQIPVALPGATDSDTRTGMVAVPRPPLFTQPPVINDPLVGRYFRQAETIQPALRQGVTQVLVGPNADVAKLIAHDLPGWGPERYAQTNLQGLTNPKLGTISLNPAQSDQDLLATMAHELTHISGDVNEVMPEFAASIVRRPSQLADSASPESLMLQALKQYLASGGGAR